jgi:predicted phosphodiesterase
MKIAIMSDIHGNWEALEAVLRDIDGKGGVDAYWCLGDTVDYGPDPHLCLAQMRQLKALSIIGNHDAAVCGKLDFRQKFAGDFIQVTAWTEAHLPAGDKDYLAGLPIRIETAGFTLVHGSPRDPFWEYLLDSERAAQNLPFFNTPNCLVGHSHVSACFEFKADNPLPAAVPFSREMDKKYFKDGKFSFDFSPADSPTIHLTRGRTFINPGSVGHQRTKDPRAAYAVYNDVDSRIDLRRVEYDVEAHLRKMREAGLPEWLIKSIEEKR